VLFMPSVSSTTTLDLRASCADGWTQAAIAEPMAVPFVHAAMLTRSRFCCSQSCRASTGQSTGAGEGNEAVRSLGRSSMNFETTDLTTSMRFIRRLSISKFIEERPNDRIGLIAFAAAPYLVSPLTLDHDWLPTESRPRQHRRRGRRHRHRLGDRRLRQPSAHDARKIQGRGAAHGRHEQHGKDSPLSAAEAAKALGVKVYTIGVGVRGKAPIR